MVIDSKPVNGGLGRTPSGTGRTWSATIATPTPLVRGAIQESACAVIAKPWGDQPLSSGTRVI